LAAIVGEIADGATADAVDGRADVIHDDAISRSLRRAGVVESGEELK
jgi:hypothetical protein